MKAVVRTNFDDSVSAYDAYERQTGRFTALARLLAAEMAARADGPFAAVLDAGAGTGVSTRVFADRTQRTVALDISREMLRELESAPRVAADFDHLPFVDDTFDGVAFTASLFLVPDPAVAAREAARVLRPEGVVGAVAPLGWVDADGEDVFATLERESRSPVGADEVEAALDDAFTVTAGTWRFATTAADVRRFHAIPAMAARLYPNLAAEERVAKAEELLADLEGTVEQRWRWIVGVAE
ncbi:class I SAM-dependent DNA methyltransferase [Natrinema ejinorense]|uniref:Cyclopropane-fatty-acyl-phospholipid synthase n=1 Tax=Natrinema ejinorense TaxID=373386 RepID=A0A2A5QPJ1_9EURY|nr:class I SAM-dependent methyltransferase [Natrinema ejinorense]PCR88742.1 cyclopropane-fatty-acyl-phospholipid synthase [Natrinema ejinorense]